MNPNLDVGTRRAKTLYPPRSATRKNTQIMTEEQRAQEHWLAASKAVLSNPKSSPSEIMHAYFLEVKVAWHRGGISATLPDYDGVNPQSGPSLSPVMDIADQCWVAQTLVSLADFVVSWVGLFWVVDAERGPALVRVIGAEGIRVTYLRPQKSHDHQDEWIGLRSFYGNADNTVRKLIRWSDAATRKSVVNR